MSRLTVSEPSDENEQRTRKHIKITVVGESGVGKSSIALRFVRGEFNEYSPATVCAAFLTTTVKLDECEVRLEIWDTAGQDRFHCLAPMFYRGSKASIVVYDITNKGSFEKAKTWIRELQRNGDPNMVIVLAGNKIDLENGREVAREEAEGYAESQGFIFLETSAKTCACVNDLFLELARKAVLMGVTNDQRGENLRSVKEESCDRSKMCFCS